MGFFGSGLPSVRDDGSPLSAAATYDFTGAGVTVTVTNGVATVSIPGSGGGTPSSTDNYEAMYNPKNSAYGAVGDGATDDTAAMQATFTAASNGAPHGIYIPDGTYIISSQISLPAGADFQIPYISSVNTSTDVLTFNDVHRKYTGDAIMFDGCLPTGIVADKVYFVNKQSSTTMKLYDTRANAVSGGATGLIDITGAVTTTGSITNGTSTLTVTSALNSEVGTAVLINGNYGGAGTLHIISGIPGTTLTLNQTWTGGNVSGGTITFVGQINWRYYDSGLKIIAAPGAKFKKSASYTSSGGILDLSLGSNVYIKGLTFGGVTTAYIPSGITATTGSGSAVVAVNDSKNLFAGLQITIAGVTGTKTILTVDSSIQITLTSTCDASTTAVPLTRAIVAGDDLLRVRSSHRVVIEDCFFEDCGDGAIRVSTSQYDYLAKRTSNTNGGVNSSDLVIKHCHFFNIHQFSTTTNDFVHGGAYNLFLHDNTFEHIYGSIKIANRVPGGRNLFLTNNVFMYSGDKGFEIDSMADVFIIGNKFKNITNYAVYKLSNNGATGTPGTYGLGVVGFAYHNLKILGNTFDNCGNSTGSQVGTIRLQPDSYADSTIFDYRDVEIVDNEFINVSNTSNIGIHAINGAYKNLKITGNKWSNYQGLVAIKMTLRGSATVGTNNFKIQDNIIDLNNSSSTGIWVERTAGTSDLINEVMMNQNQITGTCTRAFLFTDVTNLSLESNRLNLTTGAFWLTNSGTLTNVRIVNNTARTTGTVGWNLTSITGLRFAGNDSTTASGTTTNIQNTCSNVSYIYNTESGGAANFNSVAVAIAKLPSSVTKTANYTVTRIDDIIRVDATSGNLTMTLFSAATVAAGFRVTIKKIDATANTMTIATTGGETIDGGASVVTGVQYTSYTLDSNGTNWEIV